MTTTITIDDELINEVIAVSHYKNAQEAVIKILSDYVQTHQPKKTLFDKLHSDIGLSDAEIDSLFKRNKDTGRDIDL